MVSARIADGWAYRDEFLYWKHFNKDIGLKRKKIVSRKLFEAWNYWDHLRKIRVLHGLSGKSGEVRTDEISLAMLMTEAVASWTRDESD